MFKYIMKSFRKSGNSKQAKNFNHHEPKFINIYTTSLSIHQFIDMCCFQIFFIINNAVANIGCIYLFELLYSFFFLNIYPRVELLDQIVVLFLGVFCFVFFNPPHCYPQWPRQFKSHQWCPSIFFSPNPSQHFLFVDLLMIVILAGRGDISVRFLFIFL